MTRQSGASVADPQPEIDRVSVTFYFSVQQEILSGLWNIQEIMLNLRVGLQNRQPHPFSNIVSLTVVSLFRLFKKQLD